MERATSSFLELERKGKQDSLGPLLSLSSVPLGSSGNSESPVGLELLLLLGDGPGSLSGVDGGEGDGSSGGLSGEVLSGGVSSLGLSSLSGEDNQPGWRGKRRGRSTGQWCEKRERARKGSSEVVSKILPSPRNERPQQTRSSFPTESVRPPRPLLPLQR